MTNKYALLIGNAEYNDKKLNLKTPIEDVLALEQVLLDSSIGAFVEVRVLTNATLPEMRRALGELFTRLHRPDDMLLFYYSGHGELDDDSHLYLMARDTERGAALSYTGLDSNFIAERMSKARSRRQVIILDSCYSGAFGTGAKGGRVGTKNIFAGNGYGRYVLTASDAVQIAWEGDRIVEGEITNSFFTHYLLNGLRTGAADRNGDGVVDLNELYDHIYEGMMTASGKQVPLKFTFKERGDLAIARSPLTTDDRDRQQLTRVLLDAEAALDSGDYRRAEMLLTKVIEADPDGISGAAARSLLGDTLRERTRADAYGRVKQLVEEQAPRTAKATWEAFIVKHGNYDPDGLAAYFVEAPAPTKPKPRQPVPVPELAWPEPEKRAPAPTLSRKTPPDMQWIDIPGKKKFLGVFGAKIPAFKIAKYPLTNAQFALFLEAGGYYDRKWWTDAGWGQREKNGWTKPRCWSEGKWNGAEQPVVGVSWYEAIAYCQWLSEQTGQKILLPTEQQWQHAAQGDDRRDYPWGSEWDCKRCNNSVSPYDSNATTPVTQYEGKGDSPFGVVDMAGNIWEWCLTGYKSQSNGINGTEFRVLRGGSWGEYLTVRFRCVNRYWVNPLSWRDDWGFRLARYY